MTVGRLKDLLNIWQMYFNRSELPQHPRMIKSIHPILEISDQMDLTIKAIPLNAIKTRNNLNKKIQLRLHDDTRMEGGIKKNNKTET